MTLAGSGELDRWVDELDGRARRSVTGNGVTVVSDSVDTATSCVVAVIVTAGSRDEAVEHAGAFHFLEHLVFQGTRRRSAHEVNAAIDAVGGELNAYTSKESTSFYARVPWHHQTLAAELVCELVSEPALDPADVDSEREVIEEELAMALDSPEELCAVRLNEALYEGHPLGWEVIGSPETLGRLDASTLADHHRHWFGAPNLLVAAAGRVDHDELMATVERRLSGATVDGRLDRSPPSPLEPRRHLLSRDVELTSVGMAWRSLGLEDPDRYAVAVLGHALGDGPTSRLFRIVRDERGLAYSISASPSAHMDAGSFVVTWSTSAAHLGEVLAVVADQVGDVMAHGITDDELRLAQGYLCGATLLGLEDAGARMGRLALGEMLPGGPVTLAATLDGYRSVTAEEVQRVAQRLLGTPPVVVAVGRREGLRLVEQAA